MERKPNPGLRAAGRVDNPEDVGVGGRRVKCRVELKWGGKVRQRFIYFEWLRMVEMSRGDAKAEPSLVRGRGGVMKRVMVGSVGIMEMSHRWKRRRNWRKEGRKEVN